MSLLTIHLLISLGILLARDNREGIVLLFFVLFCFVLFRFVFQIWYVDVVKVVPW